MGGNHPLEDFYFGKAEQLKKTDKQNIFNWEEFHQKLVDNSKKGKTNILDQDFQQARLSEVVGPILDILTHCLQLDPAKRPTASELLDIVPGIQIKYSQNLKLVIQDIEKFGNLSFFQKIIVMKCISNPIDKTRFSVLETAYRQLDLDGDGIIQKAEMIKALEYLFPNKSHKKIKSRARKLFDKIDFNKDETLDFVEYLNAATFQMSNLEAYAKETFDYLDQDNSGQIEQKEFVLLFPEGLRDLALENFNKFDVNGSGEVDYAEFKDMILNCT